MGSPGLATESKTAEDPYVIEVDKVLVEADIVSTIEDRTVDGLGPGSGGRLRLGGSDRLGDGQIGYGSDQLGCDGSDRIGCKGSNQLGLGSDNQIEFDGLTWAGDGINDGRGGHRSRQGAGGGGHSVDDRGSDSGWTKADSEAATGVGSRADQGEESGSALLARIVFDKDNPAGRSNTLHSVVLLRE